MNKRIFRNFCFIIFPILIFSFLVAVNNLYKDKEYTIKSVTAQNQLQDNNTAQLIEQYMLKIIENLKVVHDSDELSAYVNQPSPENEDELTALFLRIMKNKSDFDQVRYIDSTGQEIIRINHNKDLEIIASENLQNKKDTYYFEKTIQLNDNEIYISPLDLNIENKTLEIPYKPVIRFAMPVYNRIGLVQGVLIINYDAYYFLELIKSSFESEGMANQEITETNYILNKSGQYILHPDDTQSFSFMTDETLKYSNDQILGEILNNDSGYIENDSMLYTYYDALSAVRDDLPEYQEQWIILHEINTSNLLSVNQLLNNLAQARIIFFLAITIILSLAIAYAIEILKQKDTQLELTRKIAESSNEAVIITDNETKIIYVNKAFEAATGYSLTEVVGTKPGDFKSGKHSQIFYQNMWEAINTKGQWHGTLWDRKKDGLLYPKNLRIIAVKNKKEAHHYIGIFSDLSSNKRKTDVFETLHFREGQLILPNEKIMLELMEQSTHDNNLNFMIIYIAIDNFNQLIASFEGTDFDSSDTFINLIKPYIHYDDFIAQTGRNLFVAMINLNHLSVRSEIFLCNLHKEITKVVNFEGRNIFFKTRFGVSLWPEDTTDLKKLLSNALIALEWTGKNHDSEIAFYQESMRDTLNQANEIEGYLRDAVKNNELTLVYQPQIDIQSGKTTGMEALLRWNNPVLGRVSPAIFIPIAENNNLMIEIGNWVIEKACSDLSIINNSVNDRLRCAINISPIQMEENIFKDKLLKIIDQYNLNYNQIEIEITEGMLMNNQRDHTETLKEIQTLGIRISLDDFGTGYSSFSYLNALPVDKIKIDRSFIKDYPELDDGTLLKILVDMSKRLKKTVLVEGAETIEQVDLLKKIGCNSIQGYYYSQPLDLETFISFINQQN